MRAEEVFTRPSSSPRSLFNEPPVAIGSRAIRAHGPEVVGEGSGGGGGCRSMKHKIVEELSNLM